MNNSAPAGDARRRTPLAGGAILGVFVVLGVAALLWPRRHPEDDPIPGPDLFRVGTPVEETQWRRETLIRLPALRSYNLDAPEEGETGTLQRAFFIPGGGGAIRMTGTPARGCRMLFIPPSRTGTQGAAPERETVIHSWSAGEDVCRAGLGSLTFSPDGKWVLLALAPPVAAPTPLPAGRAKNPATLPRGPWHILVQSLAEPSRPILKWIVPASVNQVFGYSFKWRSDYHTWTVEGIGGPPSLGGEGAPQRCLLEGRVDRPGALNVTPLSNPDTFLALGVDQETGLMIGVDSKDPLMGRFGAARHSSGPDEEDASGVNIQSSYKHEEDAYEQEQIESRLTRLPLVYYREAEMPPVAVRKTDVPVPPSTTGALVTLSPDATRVAYLVRTLPLDFSGPYTPMDPVSRSMGYGPRRIRDEYLSVWTAGIGDRKAQLIGVKRFKQNDSESLSQIGGSMSLSWSRDGRSLYLTNHGGYWRLPVPL